MARCKNTPESLRAKSELADRLREVRTDQFGERGGPELSRQIGLPVRTWYNYEVGVTVPAEILLRFIELTSVEPLWLLRGLGPKYREIGPTAFRTGGAEPDAAVSLLRHALQMLEQSREDHLDGEGDERVGAPLQGLDGDHGESLLLKVRPASETEQSWPLGPRYLPVQRDWVNEEVNPRCLRLEGDAMEPILSDGAFIGYAPHPEAAELLDGSMVVYRHEGKMLVRWLQMAGRYALLRAENESAEPTILPIDLEASPPQSRQFRRVLWACTSHGTSYPYASEVKTLDG